MHLYMSICIYIYIFAGPCAQGVLDHTQSSTNKEINPLIPSPNPLPQGGLGAQSW